MPSLVHVVDWLSLFEGVENSKIGSLFEVQRRTGVRDDRSDIDRRVCNVPAV